MAYLNLYKDRLSHNFHYLNDLFDRNHIQWGVVTKLLCGHKKYLQEIIRLGPREIHDSRIINLRKIKKIAPDTRTIYIKPPSENEITQVVRYADISLNTESYTIRLLSEEAIDQGKVHGIILMLETGDLREGIVGDRILKVFRKVKDLPGIRVIGIGTNLNCLNGVHPTRQKLKRVVRFRDRIETQFQTTIPLISAGSSAMLPLLLQGHLPPEVNHFRVGETLFFGNNLLSGWPIPGMFQDVFELFTQIIDITKKANQVKGVTGRNVLGEKTKEHPQSTARSNYRALIDIGELDINARFLVPKDDQLAIAGATSDITVVNLGRRKQDYKVGHFIRWHLQYMGALHLMNSVYINKKITEQRVDPDRIPLLFSKKYAPTDTLPFKHNVAIRKR